MENYSIVIDGCKNRNHKYQRILYDKYRGYAFKIAFRYLYLYEDAADAVNDGFVKLLNSIDKFEPKEGVDDEKLFMGWLKKMMINTSIDRLRKERKNIETSPIADEVWEVPDNENQVYDTLFYNDVMAMVKKLPSAYRAVFNLYVIDGYSHVEIAEMIDIPESTSRSNLLRARTLLQNSIIKSDIKIHAVHR